MPMGASFTRHEPNRCALTVPARRPRSAQVVQQHLDERLLQPAQRAVHGDEVAAGRRVEASRARRRRPPAGETSSASYSRSACSSVRMSRRSASTSRRSVSDGRDVLRVVGVDDERVRPPALGRRRQRDPQPGQPGDLVRPQVVLGEPAELRGDLRVVARGVGQQPAHGGVGRRRQRLQAHARRRRRRPGRCPRRAPRAGPAPSSSATSATRAAMTSRSSASSRAAYIPRRRLKPRITARCAAASPRARTRASPARRPPSPRAIPSTPPPAPARAPAA